MNEKSNICDQCGEYVHDCMCKSKPLAQGEPFFKTKEEYEDFKAWWQETITKRLADKDKEIAALMRERGLPPQLYDEMERERDALRATATDAYNALVDAMETLIVCDHISMMRHPQLVDRMHQAVNGLKRTLHACKP